MHAATVACIKWGSLFGADYVNRLYSGVRRHFRRPVRFLCMTEQAQGIHPDVEILALPDEPFRPAMDAALAVADRKGAMRKVSLFRPGLIPGLDGPVLGFDLDVVITGGLDEIYDFAPGKVAMRADWVEARRGRPTGHGSVFRYDPARHGYLYETMAADPTGTVERARGSEQRMTSTLAQAQGDFAYLPPDQVVSFKHDCYPWFPLNWALPPKLPAERPRGLLPRPSEDAGSGGGLSRLDPARLPADALAERALDRPRPRRSGGRLGLRVRRRGNCRRLPPPKLFRDDRPALAEGQLPGRVLLQPLRGEYLWKSEAQQCFHSSRNTPGGREARGAAPPCDAHRGGSGPQSLPL